MSLGRVTKAQDQPCVWTCCSCRLRSSMNWTLRRGTVPPTNVGCEATHVNTLAAFDDVSISVTRDDTVPSRDTNMCGGDTLYLLGGPYSKHTHTLWLKFHLARLDSTRLDSTRSTLSSQSSQSRQACRARRAVLFQHGGRRTILYKFNRFYALAYTNPICFIK